MDKNIIRSYKTKGTKELETKEKYYAKQEKKLAEI